MSKRIVIKADLVGSKCRAAILSTVAKLKGIKSMDIDAESCTLTVVGAVDPVSIVLALKKACLAAAIVSVEDDVPDEPPEKTPEPEPKEPCHCQQQHEAAAAALQACVPECYYRPCVLPNCCYYYRAFRAAPYGYYAYCDEGPAPTRGECNIQ